MAATLAELLATPTEEDIRQQLLSDLNAADFPITDWESGSVMRTYVEMLARAYFVMLAQLIPLIAGGGFLEEADDDWITLLAKQMYNLDRVDATFTVQKATLTCDGANGPHTIAIGQLVAETTAGRRHRNSTGGTLNTSSTLELLWTAEGPNDSSVAASNYIDGANTMTSLLTPLSGVTVNNPAVDFTPVSLFSVASTLVTPSRTVPGTAPTALTILIKITGAGNVGGATFAYRRIGIDSDYVTGGATAATYDIPQTGTRISFVDHPTISPTYQAGDVFSFSAPGGPIQIQGRDKETASALALRCMARWPALSDIPTAGKYQLWAFEADRQVTKVGVSTDLVIPNRVNVTIGGQLNPLGGPVIATVQQFIDRRLSGVESALVSVATPKDVYISGTVTVPTGQTAAAQTAADAAWQVEIAGLDLGGTARLAALQKILGDAGAIDLASLQITGANAPAPPTTTPNVNLAADGDEVLTIGSLQLPSQALAWQEASA